MRPHLVAGKYQNRYFYLETRSLPRGSQRRVGHNKELGQPPLISGLVVEGKADYNDYATML